MSSLANSYFQKLFTSGPTSDPSDILQQIRPCVTPEMNQGLTAEFTKEEIFSAIKHMAPLKASGYDGFPALFYLKYWHIEAWISGPGNGKVNSDANNSQLSVVADLINSEDHTWKEDIIFSNFNHQQAVQILFRSGYRWLTNSTNAYSNDPISVEETWYNKFLGSVWALKLPSKIKIHFWRVINNFIPTFSNLVTRKISVQTQCLLCQSESESVSHLVKGCSFTQQVLSELGILTCPWQTEQSFASWLSAAFESLNSTARRTFFVALWAIWGS
ncbi:hypothetical protein V6N11_077545 [Hibiscus sabdariffa]|uniref:Reverse transcriptase zinc-binding domain-containing protein n=1 Tax=Hibiscus sabdariffa TaxID=183260 RepID=A0ABR2TDF0_9ROSI